jgi:hypothetical protein
VKTTLRDGCLYSSFVHGKERELKKHSYLALGKRYLDHLLRMRRYEAAGALCSKLLAKDKKAWEEQVFR